MRTRRFLLLGVVTAVALLGAACGGAGDGTDVNGGATPDQSPEAAFETIEEGVLTVGSDIPFPPFEFREGGELTGFDVELMEEMATRMGIPEVSWVDTAFDTIFTQLAGGRFDMVASATTITEERAQTVNFTIPYYEAQQAVTINAEETPDIQSVDDLGEGDTVAVQRGTTGEAWAQENLEPEGVTIRSFPEAPDTYTALEAGQVTAVIFDEPSAVEEAEAREALEVVDTIDTDEEYGFPVDPQNEELLEAANEALQEMIDDGTYQQIYEKYFPEAPAGSVAEEE
ncbi:MAG TPA: basic amino acid ABC transporter substrate-binding protein [Actinomycetota bacterium]|nr:basic amino acid ABC transporter substrate-binding protein [Actinomycetota bacterium]